MFGLETDYLPPCDSDSGHENLDEDFIPTVDDDDGYAQD